MQLASNAMFVRGLRYAEQVAEYLEQGLGTVEEWVGSVADEFATGEANDRAWLSGFAQRLPGAAEALWRREVSE